MRIALVVTGGMDRSGRERVIPVLLSLVSRLAARHTVFVYVLRYHPAPCRYQLHGATICDLGRPAGLLRQLLALRAAIRADGPFDVLHAHWGRPAGVVTALLGRLTGTPTVVTFTSGELVALPEIGYGAQSSWRGRMAIAVASRLATRVTVPSQYQADLAQQHGIRSAFIPLGIETSQFPRGSRSADGPPYRLLHVASLNAVKDQATLLRAFRLIVDRGIDAHLDIVGEDTMGGAVQRCASELHLGDRVTFHGFQHNDELLGLYHQAHLFVLSSLHEAAGIVLLEAASCGVPIAGSRVGYIADWAPDRAAGVAAGEPDLLADAIMHLLQDPARRRHLADAAAGWVAEHDADWTCAAFEALYESIRLRR
jgi:glycosyltransferase involved in cell wall biosynthesis